MSRATASKPEDLIALRINNAALGSAGLPTRLKLLSWGFDGGGSPGRLKVSGTAA